MFTLNVHTESLNFELPKVTDGDPRPWRRWIDTSLDSPNDIVPWQQAPVIDEFRYRADKQSVVVLYAQK